MVTMMADPALTDLDQQRLRDALALAASVFGLTEPNPRVGCVIGLSDGTVLGRGATQQAGGPHAEAMALRNAAEAGMSVAGATAWVSLEPCAHHGRTPPCCDALIAARIGRVVVAIGDPFPQVNGQGMARLRAAGIRVDLASAEIAAAARDINIGFFSRVQRGRPWVRMKVAASLDGTTALHNGASQWITSEAARRDGHAWRRRASAVLTGIGTALADDPRLDVRLVDTPRQPLRVVLDSRFRLPATARLLAPPGRVLVVGAAPPGPASQALVDTGADVLHLANATGPCVDLQALLAVLAERGINELHLEAGAQLNGAFLAAGLVDELLLYLAPMLLGPGRPMAQWGPLQALSQQVALDIVECLPIGPDLRIRARVRGHVAEQSPEHFTEHNSSPVHSHD
jgi:diaminohydroxyphosphoribosylaminopyrimidine deaminase/5-amino-6-(5-phosphoribosylamino)uracil reductase